MKLSVIIAVFNEAGNIGPLTKAVRQVIGEENELIVVDDGSTDKTMEEIDPNICTVIRHSVNKGKGEAVQTGIRATNGDMIAFIDGDGQDDPREILKIVEAVEKGADFAIGSRFILDKNTNGDNGNTQERFSSEAVRPVNELGNKGLTGLINFCFGTQVTDSQASLKCFRASKLKAMKLESSRYQIETEMVIRAALSQLIIVEVPVHRYPRVHGKSNLYEIPMGRLRFAIRTLWTIAKANLFWRLGATTPAFSKKLPGN